MHYDIKHEMLGMVFSYAGIALDQPDAQIDPSWSVFLQECLDRHNMQLYNTGKVTIEHQSDEEAFYALLAAAEQYLQKRYDACIASEGSASGYAKQLRDDIGTVATFRAYMENIDKAPAQEVVSAEGMNDATLMEAILSALTGTSKTDKDSLIDATLKREMKTMLLQLARARLRSA